ncbi:E3 ubiquitin-protein ligase msl-2-like isoform X2 [Drosophila pseudoobscura]|uniref:E3 ubiquitin-protein ligase msl-2-like isoform X2 n=1 Tax=Drosophila pseudoobscura pseudoobscura TaxID=46245 RepID=A0A6I8VB02_DROPS|nr:E3 ubiquitin-protein ligase msl-2 isoform X2 [Drosophila pseudoobscura]
MSTGSGTGLTAAQTSFIVNEGLLIAEACYTYHNWAELEQNTSPKQSYEKTSSEVQHLNSSQKYISSTIKDKKKDTQMNPVNSKPSIISCVQETPQSATTGSPRRNAGMTKEDSFKHKCRCGTSGVLANPKTTCRNNRCRCYVSGNSCRNCRCFGCHNPHKTDLLDSNDEDELENLAPPSLPNLQSEKPAPTNATPTKPAPAFDGPQCGSVLVPVSNLEQSLHPLVLVKNEEGEYQCFNLFQGNVPIDPATVGLQLIRMQSNGYHSQIPDYAYVMGPSLAVP